jgi:hypothetical protein
MCAGSKSHSWPLPIATVRPRTVNGSLADIHDAVDLDQDSPVPRQASRGLRTRRLCRAGRRGARDRHIGRLVTKRLRVGVLQMGSLLHYLCDENRSRSIPCCSSRDSQGQSVTGPEWLRGLGITFDRNGRRLGPARRLRRPDGWGAWRNGCRRHHHDYHR